MNERWETRLKNLLWTVSGDYSLDISFEDGKWEEMPWAALYDAIKEGAYARYYDREELSLYLLKKLYLGAEERPLLQIARLCVDGAVGGRICQERPGAVEIRRKGYEEIMDHRFEALAGKADGRLVLLFMKRVLGNAGASERRMEACLEELDGLKTRQSERDLIVAVDRIYNWIEDPRFEERRGDLERVLAVTLEELKEFRWQDFLNEDALEKTLEEYQKQLETQVTQTTGSSRRQSGSGGEARVIRVSEEELKKRKNYTALNFGPTYLSDLEEERRRRLLCRDAHENCRLYYTEGILKKPLLVNYQYQYAKRQREMNEIYFRQHATLARKAIQQLTETLRKALARRTEPELVTGDSGQIQPGLLWKVGKVDTNRLFVRKDRMDQMDFVVDILIDASGSQRKRQSQVAVQGFIISRALSNLEIPHRVMSFCSFWNSTVLHRFRDYEDGPEADKNLMELFTSSNNRDGLAIRAAAYDLLQQPQDGKVLIVLSDGRPNDRVMYQSDPNPAPLYCDEFAVKDTAHEVRKVRSQGVSVLGVFAGEEEDLLAERRIFGKDFAYIHDISVFSHVAGKYLKQLLEEI